MGSGLVKSKIFAFPTVVLSRFSPPTLNWHYFVSVSIKICLSIFVFLLASRVQHRQSKNMFWQKRKCSVVLLYIMFFMLVLQTIWNWFITKYRVQIYKNTKCWFFHWEKNVHGNVSRYMYFNLQASFIFYILKDCTLRLDHFADKTFSQSDLDR